MSITNTSDPLDAIRDPEAIRQRLSQAVREADLLRRLLKLAESAVDTESRQRQEAAAR